LSKGKNGLANAPSNAAKRL